MAERQHGGSPTVGWIGLGIMGGPMCRHVINAGFDVITYARRPEATAPLAEAGARVASSVAELAAGSDLVATIVGMPSDVEQVLLGDDGVIANLRPGGTVVDLTTSEPALARRIAAAAGERGLGAVDAPVSGGQGGAERGTLSIMVGGDEAAVAAAEPVLRSFGETIVHQGGPGAGQHTKAANQILVAGAMIAMCESLLYASAAGLDPTRVLESVSRGAGSSAALTALAPKTIAADWTPGFYIEHFLKDLGIILAEARRSGLALPGVELAERLYRSVQRLGHGRSGTQALILALAEESGRSWP
ncbi:NAD(P)-dependent oxidoreductase [Microlunatus parietis]|uniref:3-hydroxyisobutyrate dehydrogenase n=1 Tax=Microlunatus parietis TaxID=682979 RepID=A0A7Y9IBT8_9ACTN|nr:NAD(P)-dependent oxidoreductase [Microlunatus parietis]NYE74028.1 3-hydroxyisobutyrate dehydrogenase [Microlunatus parietis]